MKRVYVSPEFSENTPEGQDAIVFCDFVLEVNGVFYPGYFSDKGDTYAWIEAMKMSPVSKPVSCRHSYFVE